MTTVKQAWADLAAAVAEVEYEEHPLRSYTDPAATIDPPGVLVPAPQLIWEVGCPEPTSARFLVYVMVAADIYASERLLDLVELVAVAIDGGVDAVVIQATPTAWNSGGTDLPAYSIETEVSL